MQAILHKIVKWKTWLRISRVRKFLFPWLSWIQRQNCQTLLVWQDMSIMYTLEIWSQFLGLRTSFAKVGHSIPLISREWGHYGEVSHAGLALIDLAFARSIKMNTKFKNMHTHTGSNFQHPRARGHLKSCSLNLNKPGDAIETTRHFLW